MFLIDQNEPIPRLSRLEILQRLVGILHGVIIVPRADVLLDEEVQHLPDVVGRADHAAHDGAVAADEAKGRDGGQFVLGGADLDEFAVEAQQAQVLLEGQFGARDGGDDEVKRGRVLADPVLVLVSGDEARRAHLERIFFFGARPRDGHDLLAP